MSNILTSRSKSLQQGISANDRAFRILSEHQTGVLVTASPDAKPHASVIYYVADAQLNITFITKQRTRKGEDLQRNSYAEFVVYDEKTQTTVEVSGEAIELDSQEDASQAFRNALRASLRTAGSAVPPISKLAAGDYVAYRLEADEVRLAIYNRRGSQQLGGMIEVVSPSPKS